ncbi:flippase [Gammaproteobacteria bacterium]|nr:flippase [Gammaproteobacteria bacterium]
MLQKKSISKIYIKNTSWLLLERVFRTLCNIFVGVFLARYLAPENFGVYTYVIAIVGIFSGVAKLGLDSVVVRELSISHLSKNKILGTAFRLKLVISLGIFFIYLAVVSLSNSIATIQFYISLVLFCNVFQSFEVVDFYFQAEVKNRMISIFKSLQVLIATLVKLIFVYFNATLEWFLFLIIFDWFLLSLFYGASYLFDKNKLKVLCIFDSKIAKKLLSSSWPVMLALISSMLYMRIDQLMIQHFLGYESLGMYSVATKFYEAWLMLPVILSISVMPLLSTIGTSPSPNSHQKITIIYAIAFWASVIFAIISTLFSETIILLLFGISYSEAIIYLEIVVWIAPIAAIGSISTRHLIGIGKEKKVFYRTITGLIINIFLNLLMIPRFGLMGAIISTGVCIFITHILFTFLDKELSSIRSNIIDSINVWRLFKKFSIY